MKVVVAIDSFKGCLTSKEANQAATEGIRSVFPDAEIVQIPVSDGGEGFMEAFHSAIGGELVEVTVRDPLMRPILAKYLLKDETAVIEIAQASGLTLLTKEERNPMVATSYGTGQLVADAVRKGAKQIIVGLGGSATSDAGIGMLRALIDTFARHGDKFDKMMVEGGVIEQKPKPGAYVKEGRKIYLTLNSGKEPTKAVPDLADNSSLRAAESYLQAAGFKLGPTVYIDGDQDWVYEIRYQEQKIEAGTEIPEGSMLTIVAGNGNPVIEESSIDSTAVIDSDFFE